VDKPLKFQVWFDPVTTAAVTNLKLLPFDGVSRDHVLGAKDRQTFSILNCVFHRAPIEATVISKLSIQAVAFNLLIAFSLIFPRTHGFRSTTIPAVIK
jgi:hypothetical protein